MRRFALAAVLGLAAPVAADSTPPPKPTAAKLETKPAEAKPATCKRRFVGKGLDRHVVCEFEEPIVIPAEAPKPKVVIVPANGRKIVGRPRTTDPLVGLDRRRSHTE